ncbi:transposase, IS605 OrfB family [Caldicellulosiruptor acetigenus I77R1B]|uniref:Transposase, IS605 OrfB family n=1 Tax=Caldicellulosiruptor acetigenus (strain ATCC 700853 / DSM 12137 / I77R1B) TaxID=632335 RepID=E4S7H9_CALA7|nr:RNA-guided endonuclease TnpB family protein [Caldicellulosiruptor acetigenus]ADQ39824.1 transposase, IS605 OrfB family [Caldicellulosiruptor acetigenus I77R1B]
MDKTYILPVPEEYQVLARELSKQSGKIYSKAVSFLKKMDKKGIKISRKTFDRYMEWWIHQKDFVLHSQSKQAAYQQAWTAYQATLRKLKKARKKGKDTSRIRLPYKNKKYNKVVFKESAIHLSDNVLTFSNRKGHKAIFLKGVMIKTAPKYAELIYHHSKKKYYLHVVVEVKEREIEKGKGVLAVDLGVIHPMVCFDGQRVLIYNGGVLNSKLRYRNKKIADIQQKLSLCQKGSKRFRKLEKAKRKVLRKLGNQIRDVLEKYTSHLIGYCVKNGIGTIVLGDLKGIRDRANHGKVTNQKVHQWMFGRIAKRIEEKAKFAGIDVVYVKENGTSQVCPVCDSKNKPENRNYECRSCGFKYHRDGVGAINIYRKYTGEMLLVVGLLACPTGVRFKAHLCCPTEWNVHPVGKTA